MCRYFVERNITDLFVYTRRYFVERNIKVFLFVNTRKYFLEIDIAEKIFVYINMYLVKRNIKTFSGCIRYDIFRKHMYVCTLCILVCFMERGNFSYKNYINCQLYIRKEFYYMVQT